MDVLTVDILSSLSATLSIDNFKTFFILLDLVEKAEEMTTTFVNKSFNHIFFIIGKFSPNVLCNTIDTDPFASIVIDQNFSNKFYKIMIDTGISKYSTAGYE